MPDFGYDPVISGYGNPTSLQFVKGPNGEDILISSQQDGTITLWNVTSTGTGTDKDFSATVLFQTDIINTIKNHNDDGTEATDVTNRQVTGLVAQIDENGNIDIYVTSSDPRIGGGGGALDNKNLDTNSGVLSKLEIDMPADPVSATDWDVSKIDLLRGLPRSEENHSINGIDFTPNGTLLLTVGGFTNAGSPSQNLVYTPDYFLSGAILEVDLDTIEALPTSVDSEGQAYKYDLPTLGIERGPRDGDVHGEGFSKNADNPFGGNDGYNQAYLEPGGPVSIFAEGFRNAYDVEVVAIEPGHPSYSTDPDADNFLVYTWDNGANNGWGDGSVDKDGNPITIANPGDADNVPTQEDNKPVSPGAQDQLHLVERGGYYGHPVPSRSNPDAKLYLKPEIETSPDALDENAIVAPEFETMTLRDYLPAGVDDPLNGFQPVPESGFYQKPTSGDGGLDSELVLNNGSTNGIFVFKFDSTVHPPELEQYDGNLFATGFDEQILRVEFNQDGSVALNRTEIENNIPWQDSQGSNPLDITPGPDGSIWIAAHGGNNIFAYVPGGQPIVDDSNDDDDDLEDNLDPFQLDAENGLGLNSRVSAGEVFEFTMENEVGAPNGIDGFALGFTGHMVNYNTEFFNQSSGVVKGGVLDGGIAGKLQIEFDAVGDGDARGGVSEGQGNDLTYALQAGVNFDSGSDLVLIESVMTNPWSGSTPAAGQSMGIQFGTGTQFDFAMFNFGINASGEAEVQIYIEINDQEAFSTRVLAPGLSDNIDGNGSDMVMSVLIDRENMTVTPTWSYETLSGTQAGSLAPISLDFENDGQISNNLEEAIFGAGNGGFLARGAPSNGERGEILFNDLNPNFGVLLGLAVGINGRVENAPQSGENGAVFAPEFDNLLITASNETGAFAPDAEDDLIGPALLGNTLTIDTSELLANDREFLGEALTIVEVKDAQGGVVSLNNEGQIEFTPSSGSDGTFTYVVENESGLTSEAMARVAVDLPAGSSTVLYRINAGSGTVAAIDGDLDWIGDTTTEGAQYLTGETANTFSSTSTDEASEMDLSNVDASSVPFSVFSHERSDNTASGQPLQYTFPVTTGKTYEITVFYMENWPGITGTVDRIFDIDVNGFVPTEFTDINPYAEAGNAIGTAFSRSVVIQADSPDLVLTFLHDSQNPKVNAIEIKEIGVASDPTISIGDVTVTEGGDMVFDVSASEQLNEPVTITYEVVPDTAQPGVDYEVLGGSAPDQNGVVTGSVTIASGSSDQSITVTTTNDTLVNGDRGFTINLTGITQGSAAIGDGTGQGVIQNDDVAIPASISIGDVTATEGGDMVFDVSASEPVDGLVTITFEVVPNTAQPGTDYQVSGGSVPDQNGVITGTVTIASGSSGGSITVTSIDDTLLNGDRGFTINLTGITQGNATLGDATALGIIEDDDLPISPTDIDGDGIENGDDPFAYDADNGLSNILVAGGEFVQDFDVATENPFDANGGFTGIMVNPDHDYEGSQSDPYGNRTFEENVSISDGSLSIASENFSLHPTSGVGKKNTLNDGYQSGANVSGINSFEVVARASSADFASQIVDNKGHEQFGIAIGAGGVDDFIKLVISDDDNNSTSARVNLSHNNTLEGGRDNNYNLNSAEGPTVDISQVGDYEFRLIVDKDAGTVVGQVDFFSIVDGTLLTSFTTPAANILPNSAFAAAMNGENPLTGGLGGISYGVLINDWGAGDSNQITADYDFLRITALDEVVETVVSVANAESVVESGDTGATALQFEITASTDVSSDIDVSFTVDLGSGPQPLTQTVTLVNGTGVLTVSVPNDDLANGPDTVNVVLTDVLTQNFVVNPSSSSASGTVLEDEFQAPYDEAVDGDLSEDNLAPTIIGVATGDNLVTATHQGEIDPDDRDFFTITIEEGHILTAITLNSYEGGDEAAFIGLYAGSTFDADIDGLETDPSINPADEGVLGGLVYGAESVGTNILPLMGDIGLGFDDTLPAGEYTFWLNQNGPTSTSSFNFFIEQASVLSIADAPSVLEAGDEGVTTLIFPIDVVPPVADEVDIQVSIDFGAGPVVETRTVTIDENGEGALSVEVANDTLDNGTDIVSVTVLSVSDSTYAVDTNASSATGSVTEDDIVDPDDIDGDGILNTDDPFAYDDTNGDANVLVRGGTIAQEFNTDTPDVFSVDGGFEGIIVNPDFDPPGASETDPYGDRTTETGTFISNGVLSVTSSETDLFQTGTDANNAIKDNYVNSADVTNVDTFEIEARVENPFVGGAPTSFASFGITLGAGGVDDYIKFVLGGSNQGPRIQLGQENSLAGVKEENIGTAPAIDASQATDIVFKLIVDKLAGTVVGEATFFNSVGDELGVVSTSVRDIDPTGSLAAAINGLNPLTGGDGGIAYGISITDWGGAESFVAEYDYLRLTSNDEPIDEEVPTAIISPIAPIADPADPIFVEVTYADDLGLDEASIDGTDLTLSGPGVTGLNADSVVFDPVTGVASYTFLAPPIGWSEGDYTFDLAADAVVDGAGKGVAAAQANVAIDFATTVSIAADQTEAVIEAEGAQVTFTVNLSEPVEAGQSVSVDYAIGAAGDTATGGEDYIPSTGQLVFAAGQSSQTITVNLVNDLVAEDLETFSVTLTGASDGTNALAIATATAQVSIAAEEALAVAAGSDETVTLSDLTEEVDVSLGGNNAIEGTAAQLDDALIKGFDEGDSVVVQGGADLVSITMSEGSVILGMDTTGNSAADSDIVFADLPALSAGRTTYVVDDLR